MPCADIGHGPMNGGGPINTVWPARCGRPWLRPRLRDGESKSEVITAEEWRARDPPWARAMAEVMHGHVVDGNVGRRRNPIEDGAPTMGGHVGSRGQREAVGLEKSLNDRGIATGSVTRHELGQPGVAVAREDEVGERDPFPDGHKRSLEPRPEIRPGRQTPPGVGSIEGTERRGSPRAGRKKPPAEVNGILHTRDRREG